MSSQSPIKFWNGLSLPSEGEDTSASLIDALFDAVQMYFELYGSQVCAFFSLPTLNQSGTQLTCSEFREWIYGSLVGTAGYWSGVGLTAGDYYLQKSSADTFLTPTAAPNASYPVIATAHYDPAATPKWSNITRVAALGYVSGSGNGNMLAPVSAVIGRWVKFASTDGKQTAQSNYGDADLLAIINKNLQSDSAYVHNTGDESIEGVKTFSVSPEAPTPDGTNSAALANVDFVRSLIENLSRQLPVLSMAVDTPPVTPSEGDRYIIPAGATGAWSTHVGDIAEWTGAAWDYQAPSDGWMVINLDDTPLCAYTYSQTLDAWTLSGQMVQAYTASNGVQLVGADLRLDLADTNPSIEIADGGARVKVNGESIERTPDGLSVREIIGSLLANLSTIAAEAGIIPVTNLGDGADGLGLKALHDDGTWKVPAGGGGGNSTAPAEVAVVTGLSASLCWIDMPSPLTEFYNTTRYRFAFDTTRATQYRLTANISVAGASSATLDLQYSDDGGVTWHACGDGSGALALSPTTGYVSSAWCDLVPAACSDVLFRLVGQNGNGTADPTFWRISVQFLVPGGDAYPGDMLESEYATNGAPGKVDVAVNADHATTADTATTAGGVAWDNVSGKPSFGTAATADTGTTEGKVPLLGVGGVLPTSMVPALSIVQPVSVASQAAMLALTAQRGDVAVRTDIGKTFILSTDDPTTLANWIEMPAIGAVVSVNGQQGVIVLSYGDVGAAPSANGVTNGDTHDHHGGDGAQIDYTHLSNLPTLVTALDGLSDVAITSIEKGDVLYFDGTNVVNLHHGAAEEVLTTKGHDAAPVWQAIERPMTWNLPTPKLYYDKATAWCLLPKTKAAHTFTKVNVTHGADPTTELNANLMYADDFISKANATLICALDTTNGVTELTSFSNATVPSGKCVYILFDAAPDTDAVQLSIGAYWKP